MLKGLLPMPRSLFSSLMLLLVGLLILSPGTQAQQPSPASQFDRSRAATLREQLRGAQPAEDARRNPALASAGGRLNVVIELDDAPTTQVFAQASAQAASAAQAQLNRIERAQQRVVQALNTLDTTARVIYRVQRVYNGVAATIDPTKLRAIAGLPGVKAIHPLVPKFVQHTTSVPLIGAPEVWNSTGFATTGEGIDIGIIDTGIDYIHTNFGGPGATAYAANDTTVITDTFGSNLLFPTAKVVGGYDFAGDAYNAGDPNNDTPQPDPDPMDCNGHGTHVAGTAAGYGVNPDGSTYTGGYDNVPFDTLRIGPGVAPRANLYALRVFGCAGSTLVTDQAIEWAVDPNGDGDFSDRLDVINMSLGSDYGGPYDTTSIASDNAAQIGVIVVAAAGNAGDTYYIHDSPGVALRAIGVAGSTDSSSVVDAFRVNLPAAIAGLKPASFSVLFDWDSFDAITDTLVYPASQPTGCQPFNSANAALINGNIVLLDWTENECGSITRTSNAVAAGAVGAILIDNDDVFDLFISGSPVIPAVSTPKSVGDELKSALATGPVEVTLSSAFEKAVKLVEPDIVDTIYSASSRGPRRGDSFLKPDITAPAVTIFSAAVGTGDEGASFNGTSMATPHVAGTMALLRQLHPSWTVEELKALVMNNATNDIFTGLNRTGDIYGPGRIGAGRVDVPNAAERGVVAYNAADEGAVSVSFGAVEVVTGTTFTAAKPIRVINKGSSAVTYTVGYDPRVTMPGVNYSLSASTINLAAGSSALLTVTLTADPTQMTGGGADETVPATQSGLPRHRLHEAAGYVTLTESAVPSSPALRVPVHAVPRLASNMNAAQTDLNFGANLRGTTAISLTGQGIDTSELLSLVTAFELQYSSPRSTDGISSSADLQYVGAMSDIRSTATVTNPNGVIEDAYVYFGISTYSNWTLPNSFWDTWFEILIDTNGSGIASDGSGAEFLLYNTDLGTAQGIDGTDVFISVLENLATEDLILADFINVVPASVADTAPYNNSVLVLSVSAADLGLNNANSTISYRVTSYQSDYNNGINYLPVETSALATYDVANPGIAFNDALLGPAYADLPDATIPISFDRRAYVQNRSQGVLLLHHHNRVGERAEVLGLAGGGVIYQPIIRR